MPGHRCEPASVCTCSQTDCPHTPNGVVRFPVLYCVRFPVLCSIIVWRWRGPAKLHPHKVGVAPERGRSVPFRNSYA